MIHKQIFHFRISKTEGDLYRLIAKLYDESETTSEKVILEQYGPLMDKLSTEEGKQNSHEYLKSVAHDIMSMLFKLEIRFQNFHAKS